MIHLNLYINKGMRWTFPIEKRRKTHNLIKYLIDIISYNTIITKYLRLKITFKFPKHHVKLSVF